MAADNPFVDPVTSEDETREASFTVDSTLTVGRDASLTLGTDTLIVLDEAFEEKDSKNCCGIFSSSKISANTRAIPFYNIVWAEFRDGELVIDYAAPKSKTAVQAATLNYRIENPNEAAIEFWVMKLVDRAYGPSQRRKRVKVLVNPHAGRGRAVKWYGRDVEPLLKAARCTIDMVKTKYSGEAIEITENLDVDAYDVVACCSGDGLPYEVFNGLGKRPDARNALSRIAVVHIPCGSGNAMSCNLNGTYSVSLATLAIIKGIPTPLDLISISQGETRFLSFLSQSLGIVAELDLATEHIRWMGQARFTYGFLTRLIKQTTYPCDIAVKVAMDDKSEIREHWKREKVNREPMSERRGYNNFEDDDASARSGNEDGLPPLRYGTINDKLPDGWEMVPHNLRSFYCGNMAYMAMDQDFFPAALPNDGYMDLVCITADTSRLTAIQMMLSVENGKFFDIPEVWYRKILGYRVIPRNQEDGYVSIDGERIPFAPFQAEVHRGLGTVLTKSGHLYEARGP
ncbi:sphingoid long chain base kinase-like protein [Calycina marina]|uniref:Sphingoid long chain base kinase-like protein n=1 Tax=Calycina marina TaxID=1763456 RepID=A0A9P7YZR0_9HELO|nr:sphingoid long chain base kinase-like protein [Calycina marina]